MNTRIGYTDLGVYICTDPARDLNIEGRVLDASDFVCELANKVKQWPVAAEVEPGLYYMNYTRFENFLDI